MPTYYDKKAHTWFCKFYYTDAQGMRRQKKKRGFKRQRDAKAWERSYLSSTFSSSEMTFQQLTDLYLSDMEKRLRQTTMNTKQYIFRDKILPYFSQQTLSSITSAQIRSWQNELLTLQKNDGTGYSSTYLKTIQNQLSAVFNYAVRYYHLSENPCLRAGSLGKSSAEKMHFWTYQEFNSFLSVIDKERFRLAFLLLYHTGIRIGELLALTPTDFHFQNKQLYICKSLQRLHGETLITSPKTPKSIRSISLPSFLLLQIQEYIKNSHISEQDLIFPFTKSLLGKRLKQYADLSGVPKIRLHDLRHSHASLLIELGFPPLLIAERLGHEKIETTLNIYGHLYPNKQLEIARSLEALNQNSSF